MKQLLILGPPGTGKTTRALRIVEQKLAEGVPPHKIAFVSFTKKAVREAVDRACDKFRLSKKDFHWFRTLHSLAYHLLGLRKEDVMGAAQYREVGALLGLKFQGTYSEDDGLPNGNEDGDRMLFLDNVARARRVSLEEQYRWADPEGLMPWHQLKLCAETLRTYKMDTGLVDYTDMLLHAIDFGGPLDEVDIAIVDEAQDLSPVQWEFVRVVFAKVKELYIAGDDDQAIFRWNGADVEHFLRLEGEKEVLPLSYRLPRSIWNFANRISSQITHRYPKQWAPRDEEGEVQLHRTIHSVDMSEGNWLVLVRNLHHIAKVREFVHRQGYPYSTRGGASINQKHVTAIRAWETLRKGETLTAEIVKILWPFVPNTAKFELEEGTFNMAQLRSLGLTAPDAVWHDALEGIPLRTREYYLSLLRRGESLTKPPRIHLSSIHASKGGEADNVLLLTDMAQKTFRAYRREPEDEHRVFYVGATRAKRALHILYPQTPMGYLTPV